MDRGDDGVEQFVDRLVADQAFRELREVVRRLAAALGFDSRGVQTRHDARHEQHDDDVDAEGGPVLRRADVERLVRRDVAVVVDEEAGDDARDAGLDAPDGRSDHDRV